MAIVINIGFCSIKTTLICPKNIINNKPSLRAFRPHSTHEYQLHRLNARLSHLQFPVHISTDYEHKLEDVRRLLVGSSQGQTDHLKDSLIFVDAIQRLGFGRHYEGEIRAIIEQQLERSREGAYECHSLHDASLSFRLSRQQGYHVSADNVFNHFTDENGKFRGKLKEDVRGLLELFEATHVSFEGEKILDRAQEFSQRHLSKCLAANAMDPRWSNIVRTRIGHPYHKSITRMTEHSVLSGQGCMTTKWGRTLGELAKIDLLVRRSLYQEEHGRVSEWWSALGLTNELRLARNQPLKWYTWSMAILMDHLGLSEQRVRISKTIAFIYLIDDIFDLYRTPYELSIFVEAVSKWDYTYLSKLPSHMKTCYKALLDTTHEIACIVYQEYGYNPIDMLKQTWKDLCDAFLVEAKWFESGYWPRPEDYLANAKVSSGVHVVLVHLFHLLGLGPTHEGRTYLKDIKTLVSCVATILRLWDDLGSAKDEQQDGTDGSYVECYMREHPGSAPEHVREHVMDMIGSEWKRLNRACFDLGRSSPSRIFQEACLNLARTVPLMYSYDQNQRLPILRKFVEYVLLSPTS